MVVQPRSQGFYLEIAEGKALGTRLGGGRGVGVTLFAAFGHLGGRAGADIVCCVWLPTNPLFWVLREYMKDCYCK